MLFRSGMLCSHDRDETGHQPEPHLILGRHAADEERGL